MGRLLKYLLCFVSVPLFLALVTGGFLGLVYILFNFAYIVLPIGVLIFWIFAARDLHKDWFS